MRLVIALLVVSLSVALPCLSQADDTATQRAIVEYRLENYEEALHILAQVQATKERTTLSDYYTGLCQKETGSYADAVKSFTSAVQGQPPVKEAAFELAASLDSLDRPDEALKWVAWAEREQVKPHETAFLKGQLLVKKKRYNEALVAFNAARTGKSEDERQIDLQIAVIYAQEGKNAEASKSLKAIITRYPGTDVAEFAAEYDQRISAAAAAKRWNLFAGVNYQYDDNVTVVPKLRSAPRDPRNENSSGFSENVRFEYDAPLGGRWAGNLQYSVQNTNYTRLHEFNTLSHGLTLTAIHRDDFLMSSIPVNVSQTVLDYNSYSFQAGIKPTETFIFAPEHLGQVTLGYSRREMFRSTGGAENSRTGNIYNAQLAYIFLFAEGQGMLNLRGELFYEDTNGTEFRNLGSRVGVDGLVPLTGSTKLILSTEGTWQDYRNRANAGRNDTIVIASTTVNQRLVDNLYLNLQYSYTRAMSNDDLYDYQRNLISTGLELRF